MLMRRFSECHPTGTPSRPGSTAGPLSRPLRVQSPGLTIRARGHWHSESAGFQGPTPSRPGSTARQTESGPAGAHWRPHRLGETRRKGRRRRRTPADHPRAHGNVGRTRPKNPSEAPMLFFGQLWLCKAVRRTPLKKFKFYRISK